ncbi:MAG: hypothetical protein J5J06_04705 [Phycisphaerae bacterium]|nr:hypothetical protein [Phycisphaerae bacterium]
MSDEPPYYLELRSLPAEEQPEEVPDGWADDSGMSADKADAQSEGERSPVAAGPRPWIGVRFDCCSVYTRIYRNRDGTAYEGQCPRCLQHVRLRVGPGGTSSRFFVAE